MKPTTWYQSALFAATLGIGAAITPQTALACSMPGGGTCGSGPTSLPGGSGPSLQVGNPIHLATGNKYQQEIDLPALPGVLGLELTRHYNSRTSYQGLFGVGWRMSYEAIAYAEPGNVQILQADGRRIVFSRDPKNPSLCASARALDGIVEETDKAFVWRWPNGRELRFAKNGRLEQIVERTGEAVSLVYDPRGHLVSITDAQARTLSFDYKQDALHRRLLVSAVRTPVGIWQYEYDTRNNLVAVHAPADPSIEQGKPVTRLYHYEADKNGGDPFNLTGISIRIEGDKPVTTRLSSYWYDERDRAYKSERLDPPDTVSLAFVEEGSTDTVGKVRPGMTRVTDGTGATTDYRWTTVAGDYVLTEAQGPGCRLCPVGGHRYGYDASTGLLARDETLDSAVPSVETRRYDKLARLVRVDRTGADARTVRYDYRGSDRLPITVVRSSVVAGHEARLDIEYNEFGQPTHVVDRGFAPALLRGPTASDAIERETRYRYERIAGASRLVSIDGPLPGDQDVTRWRYDRVGRVSRIEHPAADLRERFEYDGSGQPSLTTPSDAVPVRTALNRLGLPARIERGDRVEVAAYDALGRLVRIGANDGSLAAWPLPDNTSPTSPASPDGQAQLRRISWQPDASKPRDIDSTIERAVIDNPQTQRIRRDANGQVWQRWFDDFGRLSAVSSPVTGLTVGRYDANGQLIEVQGRLGIQRAQYDSVGRLLRHAVVEADGSERELARFSYHGAWLVGEDSADVHERRTIDAAGRLVGRRIEVAGHVFTWRYRHDANGLVGVDLPDGHTIQYERAAGQVRRMTIDGKPVVSDVEYLTASSTPSRYRLGAVDVAWQADAASGQAQVVNAATDASVTWQTGRSQPVTAWPTRKVVDAPAMAAAPTMRRAVITTDTGRPATSADLAVFLGDPVDASAAADPDTVDRSAQTGLPSQYAGWSLGYDKVARLTHADRDATHLVYGYSARGVQTVVRRNGQLDRIQIYDGYRRVLEADCNGRVVSQTAWLEAPGADRPVARITSTGIDALYTDARGGVIEARALDGAARWSARLSASGRLLAVSTTSPASAVSLRLPGQVEDPDTGLYYNVARNYDPVSGRYLEPDPIALQGGDDVYAYAGGQPLSGIDVWGLASLQYYAIDSGARSGTNQMPDGGHWAFVITGITGHEDQVFIYDRGGNFYTGQPQPYALTTSASNPVQAFTTHYNSTGYYSPGTFTRTLDDAVAMTLIKNLTGTDLGVSSCVNVVLPTIDLGSQGTLDPKYSSSATPTRITPCDAAMTADQIRRERLERAIDVHESHDNDCARTDGCPATTWNPSLMPGTSDRQPTSYGWGQFVMTSFFDTLDRNYSQFQTALTSAGITHAQITAANAKAAHVETWYRRLTATNNWATDGAQFTADTGLLKRDYDRIVTWKSVSSRIYAARTRYMPACTPLPHGVTRLDTCLWNAWQAADPAGYNALIASGATLGASRTDLNPYMRVGSTYEGEARGGFVASALFSDTALRTSVMAMFTDYALYSPVSDAWMTSKINQAAGITGISTSGTLTAAQEQRLATVAAGCHNGGCASNTTYPPKVIPTWQHTYCIAGTGGTGGTPRYIKPSPLVVR